MPGRGKSSKPSNRALTSSRDREIRSSGPVGRTLPPRSMHRLSATDPAQHTSKSDFRIAARSAPLIDTRPVFSTPYERHRNLIESTSVHSQARVYGWFSTLQLKTTDVHRSVQMRHISLSEPTVAVLTIRPAAIDTDEPLADRHGTRHQIHVLMNVLLDELSSDWKLSRPGARRTATRCSELA